MPPALQAPVEPVGPELPLAEMGVSMADGRAASAPQTAKHVAHVEEAAACVARTPHDLVHPDCQMAIGKSNQLSPEADATDASLDQGSQIPWGWRVLEGCGEQGAGRCGCMGRGRVCVYVCV